MKIHITASLIFGLLLVGVLAADEVDDDYGNATVSTTEIATTTVETTTEPITTTLVTTTVNTTVAPTTTTIPSTSTTPVPNPPDVKDPEKGSWILTENNVTCIRLDAAIQFQFSYEQVNEKYVKTKLNVPPNASLDELSSCDDHIISLTFNDTTFSLKFVKENGKVWTKSANISYTINNETFPGAKNMGARFKEFADNLTLFEVSEGNSYLCKDASEINFSSNTTGTLTNIQVEAFKNSTNSDFSSSEECSKDEKISDIVPIAVGCALAALVIIVLIAYLVGRRRTRQRGYQSV